IRVFRPRESAILGPGDWPLAGKIVLLTVSACIIVIVVLASLGYRQAADGLEDQAEHALSSDALLVTQAVDTWNTIRLNELKVIATSLAARRFLAQYSPDVDNSEGAALLQ